MSILSKLLAKKTQFEAPPAYKIKQLRKALQLMHDTFEHEAVESNQLDAITRAKKALAIK